MLDRLIRALSAPDPDPLPEADARLALAALLVRIARADGEYAAEEVDRIDRLLAQRYRLTPEDARALRAEAETVEGAAPDTVRFTRAVPHEERLAVIEALWSVVLADGVRDEEENALLRLVAPMLGINDRDSNIARKKVEDTQ